MQHLVSVISQKSPSKLSPHQPTQRSFETLEPRSSLCSVCCCVVSRSFAIHRHLVCAGLGHLELQVVRHELLQIGVPLHFLGCYNGLWGAWFCWKQHGLMLLELWNFRTMRQMKRVINATRRRIAAAVMVAVVTASIRISCVVVVAAATIGITNE